MIYFACLAFACVYVSFWDVRCRRISNYSVVFVLVIQSALSFIGHVYLESGLVVLCIGIVMFRFRWIAAGDIKLAAVMAIAIPTEYLLYAAILTGLFGGAVSVIYMLVNYLYPMRKDRQDGIPYGLAISLGFFFTIFAHQAPLLLAI